MYTVTVSHPPKPIITHCPPVSKSEFYSLSHPTYPSPSNNMADTPTCTATLTVLGKRLRDDALQLGPRKKAFVKVTISSSVFGGLTWEINRCISDPLVHHGRHFGRTVHALCTVSSIITNGLLRMGDLANEPDESFSPE